MTHDISFRDKGCIHSSLAAVGIPADFYVFDIKKQYPWSGWIKSSDGSIDYWNRLKKLKKDKDREGFQKLVDELFVKFLPKKYYFPD